MYIFISRAVNGQYYFTLETGSNFKVLATSETYHNKGDCEHGAELVKRDAGGATISDIS